MSKALRELRSDGEATRARILEAAGELFAAAGFAETTSKAIAARAGVDLASINYHFGGRGGLYQAVLIEAHRRFVDLADLRELALSAVPAADKLKRLIGQIVQQTTDDAGGWHLAVLVAEILAPSSHAQVLFQSEIPSKASYLNSILAELTGIPEDDPALLRCAISTVAPCILLLIGRRGVPGPVQELRKVPYGDLVDHLHRYAIGGLEAIGREYAGARAARSRKRRK
ncbi:CerR family C-terminal domain-containing protein [Candidimonas humi]|uniref:TetR/AcrR family transcriptional regulator n=1 Tax=Candidimonas humi TaxID=683355 RepID=A0ABV8P0B4_9BURK|nr:CerR family C-terminal domain-containing protein [Candidimonas humi]MBV6304273.1 CerR family C-terminal domain-containing protein [Candidimonas humi]